MQFSQSHEVHIETLILKMERTVAAETWITVVYKECDMACRKIIPTPVEVELNVR